MKKHKKSYNPNMIFGINGSANLLKAKKAAKNSAATQNKKAATV